MSSTDELYQIADELRGIASEGLKYGENEYDRARYKRLLAASARLIGIVERRPADEIDDILEQFEGNIFHVSPATGVEAAVFRDGKVLFIQRRDNGLWTLPGGAVDIGETLAEAACRELREEAGVTGLAVRLLGAFDSRHSGTRTRIHLNTFVFLVEAEGAVPVPGSEALDVGFFGEDNIPPLNYGQRVIVPIVFKLVRGEIPVPYFDSASDTEGDH